MPRRCSVCTHPQRDEVDELLVADFAVYRTIAVQYGLSKSALIRHKRDHIPASLAHYLSGAVLTPSVDNANT